MVSIKITQEELESLWEDFLISVIALKYKKTLGTQKSSCVYKETLKITTIVSEIEKAKAYNQLEKMLFSYFCD